MLTFLSKNEKTIHTKIVDISSFQNWVNHPFSPTGVNVKGKFVEDNCKI